MSKKVGTFFRIIVLLLVFVNSYLYVNNCLHGEPILAPRDPDDYVMQGEEKARFIKLQEKHGNVVVEGWPKKPVFYRGGKRCSYT